MTHQTKSTYTLTDGTDSFAVREMTAAQAAAENAKAAQYTDNNTWWQPQKTITLPDGYNGHTVECYTTPLEVKDGVAKLRVKGSSYLFALIRVDELVAKLTE